MGDPGGRRLLGKAIASGLNRQRPQPAGEPGPSPLRSDKIVRKMDDGSFDAAAHDRRVIANGRESSSRPQEASSGIGGRTLRTSSSPFQSKRLEQNRRLLDLAAGRQTPPKGHQTRYRIRIVCGLVRGVVRYPTSLVPGSSSPRARGRKESSNPVTFGQIDRRLPGRMRHGSNC